MNDETREYNKNLPGGGIYNTLSTHLYNYANNNPVKYTDPDGRQPVKNQSATIDVFISVMNNSPSKIGLKTGAEAEASLISFSKTGGFPPKPVNTPYFNMKNGRYIYTKKGGWIDMVHFLFYAGEARKQKLANVTDPVEKSIKKGEQQEFVDQFISPHSAYSYEDLPTDKFGAIFGAEIFDPNSDKTLGEQIQDYLNEELGGTSPETAPNWNNLPETDSKVPPQYKNKTTKPIFTSE